MITLHQLKIFWSIAQSESLTRASKLMGLAQPSLSQQLSKLEDSIGTKLFDRNSNQLILTDAGHFLKRKTEFILASVDAAIAGLQEFTEGQRGVISVGALNSLARIVLPRAMRQLAKVFPGIELDIHEVSPGEALDLLYSRRLTVALLASDSIAKSSVSFRRFPVFRDPYVLAVPRGLDLSATKDPWADLSEANRKVVNSVIEFNFGSGHQRRMQNWFHSAIPRHKTVSQARTYEVALSLVQEGIGVAVVPALAARIGSSDGEFGVDLYQVNLADREIVGLVPAQYSRVEPYATFLAAVEQAGKEIKLPDIKPKPPFIRELEAQDEHTAAEAS